MIKRLIFALCLFSLVAEAQQPAVPVQAVDDLIHHDLQVVLDPASGHLSVQDTITFPESMVAALIQRGGFLRSRRRDQSSGLEFSLNSALVFDRRADVTVLQNVPGASVTGINNTGVQGAATTRYRLDELGRGSGVGERQVVLNYSGIINDPAQQTGAEYAQSFAETSGIINDEGVFLSAASVWIPDFGTDTDTGTGLVSFELQVEFSDSAQSWTAVSQGEQLGDNHWRETRPMEEVYLIAADFTVYTRDIGSETITALAYLRTPDQNLANRYLKATERYLALYEPLLGEYPYSKFALIENFWETGYGMPSFTLLGSRVIRLPFILESSYPHEILHNWWGNAVYPDYQSGNWSEGLTAYLADHLFREVEGDGARYRKDVLTRYRNYVADDTDFPLSEFTSRNSAATQAVGYGKTLMLWHMLRLELGDELFLEGLRKLYTDYRFKRTSWADIEQLFSDLSGDNLAPFFAQWVTRTGAPELSVRVDEVAGNRARIMLAQIQADEAYQLSVPMALYYEGEEEAHIYQINLNQKLQGVFAPGYDRLQAVLVDPYFDVFRQLDREETPPTVGEMFGAERLTFVLPLTNRGAWSRLAQTFAEGIEADIVAPASIFAETLSELPQNQSVWILGKDNSMLQTITPALTAYGATLDANGVTLENTPYSYDNRSTVLIGRHPSNPELAVGFIHIDDPVATPGMTEKLPHYGRYSYLSFTGAEPTNDLSGVWASSTSPLSWFKSDTTIRSGQLPPVPPLTELPPRYSPTRLLSHVTTLSAATMGGRGVGSVGIERAAQYISQQFQQAGLQPLNGGYRQRWDAILPGAGATQSAAQSTTQNANQTLTTFSNIIGIIPGSNFANNSDDSSDNNTNNNSVNNSVNNSDNSTGNSASNNTGNNSILAMQPVIVGAHYDHLGIDTATNQYYPGADDNASGLAVMLEVAAELAGSYAPQRPILFVAFSGEEHGLLGSQHFIENPPPPFTSTNFYAMLNLDSVGRLAGRNLQVFGTDSAYEWPFMARGIGFTIGLGSDLPATTIASSDHVSFLNAGIPAIHLFGGAHTDYHRPGDTADKLDVDGMTNIARWLEEAIIYLADNTDPLRVTLPNAAQPSTTTPATPSTGTQPSTTLPIGTLPVSTGEARAARLGTVPDFNHNGPGVRVAAVVPDSAAEAAGLLTGDVLTHFNGAELNSLQTYSNLLRQSTPDTLVTLNLLRNGQPITVRARLR
ncbi:MAG: M20/M25/M40 family metallo-hydrolase [Pseudohongiellaceae bacterium]